MDAGLNDLAQVLFRNGSVGELAALPEEKLQASFLQPPRTVAYERQCHREHDEPADCARDEVQMLLRSPLEV